ncbi:MFS transporter [Streptomyces sp. Y1]|uniref:MFS transporter n=1 Tax=Streptomyces sp. Y1 TaxID=3238634 RepID=A0AB39TUV9_9ACTN
MRPAQPAGAAQPVTSGRPVRQAPRPGLVLAASVTGAVLVALDGTVLTVTQPTLQHDLHASVPAVQWTSTGYLLTVAALLVPAGRLGDRYGHRRLFTLGVAGFAAASAGIALAPGIGWVIALRVLQGVAGALLQPATLGLLRTALPAERLPGAIAARTSAIGLAAAAGPLVGGALTTHLGWRAVFLLGIPLAAAAGLLARGPLAVPAAAPEPAAGRAGFDLPGAALLALALACLVHALTALPGTGWSAPTLLGLAASAGFGLALLRQERRAARPLLPLDLLRSAAVAPALGILLTASAALFGTLFLATYYLQDVLGLSPLRSAVRAAPLALAMVLAAPASATSAKRRGPRGALLLGTSLITGGALLIARLGPGAGAVEVGGCFLLLGAGFGTVMATATVAIVRGAPAAEAGVAGGLQQTVLNVGPALGVALATTIAGRTAPGAALAPGASALAAVAAAGILLAARLPAEATQPALTRR